MMKRFTFGSEVALFSNSIKIIAVCIAVLLVLAGITGCGNDKKEQVQAPTSLVKDYIAKHATMVDSSLADLYIGKEKKDIIEQVNKSIETKKANGSYQEFKDASFDFANLVITVLDSKEEYVNDEPKEFLKIALKGSYRVKIGEGSKQVGANGQIVLEKEGDAWKVTETLNPWG